MLNKHKIQTGLEIGMESQIYDLVLQFPKTDLEPTQCNSRGTRPICIEIQVELKQ